MKLIHSVYESIYISTIKETVNLYANQLL